MPGPPPNPNARRRNAQPTHIELPAAGRIGELPKWPLGRPTKAEADIWAELWSTPQSVMWERLAYTRVVARYARGLVLAEKRDASASHLSEVRALEDRLGLTAMSMLRLRWTIVVDELAEQRETNAPARPRLKAVDPGAVAGS